MSNTKVVLRKKRDGEELSEDEIRQFVADLVTGHVSDAQLGAMMMAIYINRLTPAETSHLTRYMTTSGKTLSWPTEWKGTIVDKHSTGGIGDKISLPLVAVLTACSKLKIPMISGRGLGITGGTLDKLESIKGFKVALTAAEIKEGLERQGGVICGQTGDIVPADRLMYACRDETETVSCKELINASIISKKAAEGLDALVLDVKFGSGSTSKSLSNSQQTAQDMVAAAESLGIKCRAFVTEMNDPIGRKVGNALEVQETIEFLQWESEGESTPDLRELVITFGSHMLAMTDQVPSLLEGERLIIESLAEKRALKAFKDMIVFQGVSEVLADKLCLGRFSESLPQAQKTSVEYSGTKGHIHGIDAAVIGQLVIELGGGRLKKTDILDHAVGLEFLKIVGDEIHPGEPWAIIHHNKPVEGSFISRLQDSLTTSDTPNQRKNRVLEIVGNY